MSRRVALALGLLLIVVCALVVCDGFTGSAPEPVADEVEGIDHPIAATEPTLPAADEPRPMPRAQLEHEGKTDPASADQDNAPHATAARVLMPSSGHFELMQRAFESQTRDPSWASEQEALIPQLLIEVGFKDDAFDRNATCRGTLCRFSLVIDERDEDDLFALMKLASKLQTSDGVPLSHGEAEIAGEKSRIVVFILREGAALEGLPAD